MERCASKPATASVRRFYRFVEVLEEELAESRCNQPDNFLEILFSSVLSVELVIQALIGLILVFSSLEPSVIQSIGQYLRTVFASLLEAAKKDNSTAFDCALSAEFIHHFFASVLSLDTAEIVFDRHSLTTLLKIFKERLQRLGC
ncbi:unnamed protein product [Gongylonema pulchrum]|uniref:Uncharacterized protein n=1 Tax=Gongylonema pulchrum TaxID=637853 RepID=A0A3P6QFP1_9BILA|nr:unnamed protein product [Gongylonema pulchrum]